MKSFVWLSFDLGVKGDYEGMYAWLAKRGAKECGDSIACFWYEHSGDLRQQIKDDLNASLDLDRQKNRIYLIWKQNTKTKGSFIFGHRRVAPWASYAETGEQVDDTGS
jgi:hypothetical protein